MLSQRQQKTSVVSVLERRVSDSRDLHFTGLFPTSCVKVVTSQTTTELVENPSTEISSKMKTFNWSIPDQESSPWPMLVPTPTVRNFSCVPPRPLGWMESTLFSVQLLRAWKLSRRWNLTDPNQEKLRQRSLLLIVANFNDWKYKSEVNEKKMILDHQRNFQII